MPLSKSILIYLGTSSARAISGAGAGVGTHDTVEVWERVPLSSVKAIGAAPASLSLPVYKGFQWGIWQGRGLAIKMAK